MTPAQAERFRQFQAAQHALDQLGQLHRQDFSAPQRPQVVRPELPQFHKLLVTAERQCMRGVPLRDRARRKAAAAEARGVAEKWAVDLLTIAEREQRQRQAQIDSRWAGLYANDPDTVVLALKEAFANRGRRLNVRGMYDGEAGLVAPLPDLATVPSQKPAYTPRGAPTLHVMSQTERNEWFAQVVASELLLVAKESFVLAPALPAVRVIGVGGRGLPLVAARIARDRLPGVNWQTGAWPILHQLDPEMKVDVRGRTRALHTLDLRADAVFGALLRDD
ncbi:MAG: hypothetical protein Q8O61_16860 [Nocardioides sp.]|nr:hypothetical protein [Nocardioides sp.]